MPFKFKPKCPADAARWNRKPAQATAPTFTTDPVEAALDTIDAMPKLLTPAEVAKLLSVGERTLERWRGTGEGPPYLAISRKTVRYTEEAVMRFLASRLRRSTAG